MMQAVNLIPLRRRLARRRVMRIRAWAVVVGLAAVGLPCVGGVVDMRWAVDDRAVSRGLAQTAEEIGVHDRIVAEYTPRLRSALRARAAASAVVEQPDWSILLAILATRTGKDVVLGSVHLTSEEGGPAASAGQFRLAIHGLAREQLSVTLFVQRLQETHLLEDIQLLRTSREPYLDGQAVAFDVRCELVDREKHP